MNLLVYRIVIYVCFEFEGLEYVSVKFKLKVSKLFIIFYFFVIVLFVNVYVIGSKKVYYLL